MTCRFHVTAALTALGLIQGVAGANLKEETKEAWDAYLEARTAEMQARLKHANPFLWLDERPGRAEHVRTKGPYILPIGDHIPQPVPFGLIHAWLGAGFVPNATIADIEKIVRDYDNYGRVYKPGVIASKLYASDGPNDSFFLRLANKSVVARTVLESEGEAVKHLIFKSTSTAYTRIRILRAFARSTNLALRSSTCCPRTKEQRPDLAAL